MGKSSNVAISPHQSDATLLVSVEDLINMAMGPEEKNLVNYKLVQTVLHILARQMRLLDQRVEIRVTEYITHREQAEKEKEEHERAEKAEKASKEKEKKIKAAEKERRNIERTIQREKARESRAVSKERDRAEKSAIRGRERQARAASKEKEKAEKAAAKDKEREERATSKEREKAERAASKERERQERATSKEREKAEKAAAKDREKEERATSKEREKAEKAAAKDRERQERATSREREKADKAAAKDREREERATSKEREKAEKAAAKDREREERATSKEREKAEKTTAKDRERQERATLKEREKEEKDREREERATSKEREKAEKAAAKDREREEKDREREERATSKEREKAEKAAAKDREREERATSKEREKAEKAAAKDREREEKALAKTDRDALKDKEREEKAAAKADKQREKEERAQSKEREKAEKTAAKEERATSKEREKELKESARAERHEMKDKARAEKEQEKAARAEEKAKTKAEKEMTKAEKAVAKEKEAEQEQENAGKKKRKGTSISVKEEERDKKKILVVDKGPAYLHTHGRTNIEVVTRSQFNVLKDKVTDLTDQAGPLPLPSMPENKELLQRLSKGTASLTDTMAAMQVSARVVAAEQAIGRMGGILTQLALAGALPEDIVGQVGEVTTELEAGMKEARARAGEAAGQGLGPDVLSLGVAGGRELSKVGGVSLSRKSIISSKSKASTLGGGMEARGSNAASMVSGLSEKVPKVTHPELDDAIYQLQQDLAKNMGFLVAKSSATAEASMAMVKAVADKMETAMKVNKRISTLHTMVTEYAEQLSGFDAGLTTQLQSFGEQIVQMRGDLGAGLKLLEAVNNNAETAAVMELTERYEGLVSELDNTLQSHKELTSTQDNLGYDMRDLLDAVEMLREQKADRDEVQDGLRDKADNSRLAGLLTEEEFTESRTELERRLLICHDKFHRQDDVWMGAVRDLKQIVEVKADLVHLMGTREEAQRHLEILHEMCLKLARVLGEPKAAVLTRKLARGALCAACMVPALMEPADAAQGAPPLLPAARPRPAGAPAPSEPCEEFQLIVPTDERRHMCNRWVGGSHTQISGAVSRLHAEPMTYDAPPTKRYAGYGQDGRLYMMEEELQPCLECNKLSDEIE